MIKNIKEKLTGLIEYFTRPDIDISRRITNIILVTALLLLPINFTISLAIESSTASLIFLLVLSVIIAVFLWLVNAKPNASWPLIALTFILNGIMMPFLYFTSGGRKSGMICWIMFCTILTFLLLKGIAFVVSCFVNVGVFAAVLLLEEYHNELVIGLDSSLSETKDTIVAFALVCIIIAIVFKYQSNIYHRQKEALEEQERKLKAMNEELENASLAKTNFLTNMSHEIRTPINAILGMDEMILRDSSDREIIEYASDIESAGKQLLSLINDVLDISKIEAGRLELTSEKYEMFSILNDTYNLVIGRAKAKKLSFVIKNTPDIPAMLIGDEIRIRQMIINLVTNAIKYTEKGSVTLSCGYEKVDDTTVNIIYSIKDTGIGISKENQEKLFMAFTRIDEKIHRNIEGTGLGLAITRQMAEMMGGSIEVESEPGVGSTFTVTIPQKVHSWEPMGDYTLGQNKAEVKHSYRERFTAESASILAVDDVKVNLNVLRLLLRDTKVQIDLAESGFVALDLMKQKHYDLVLMDHMMPEMDGIETLHKLRIEEGIINPQVPVIALTANAIAGVDRMYLDEGFDGYLSKPIKVNDLEEALIKFLPDTLVTVVHK